MGGKSPQYITTKSDMLNAWRYAWLGGSWQKQDILLVFRLAPLEKEILEIATNTKKITTKNMIILTLFSI